MNAYEKIRIIRQLSKLTQTEFGESMGLSKATISNFETGRVPIPNYVIILLKLLYNIDPEWLMNDDEEDLKKRFFDKSDSADSSMQSAFSEKFKKLSEPHKKYLMRCLEELILLQKMEEEGKSDTYSKNENNDTEII
ncbi:helix-turn-helix domain-containing protein [Butyrivibrio fibrisolvens]|uniref:helix-turn-helix domain-containing protein n=1 Tax=Butyrivibrio fibrisolvens TaxID=831 RepID=UPI0003B65644|nr:helix-turn-helix transcriptional regulator [Butyrivibrio fibrisolvens]